MNITFNNDSPVQALLSLLSKYEKKRLQEKTNTLIDKNHALTGNSLGFYYAGVRFYDSRAPVLAGQSFPDIHISLEKEAALLFDELETLKRDTHKIKQSFAIVMRQCHTTQDMRDALPDTVVNSLSLFRGMKRTRSEGYMLEKDSLIEKQYKKAIEIAEYYIINRLIY